MGHPSPSLRWKHVILIWALLAGLAAAARAEPQRVWRTFEEWNGNQDPWTRLLPPHLLYSEVRIKHGDDPGWAQPDWDDSRWGRDSYWVPFHAGVLWIRFRVRDASAPLPSMVYMHLAAAHECYWDGKLIGQSGVPGNDAAGERAGKVRHSYTVSEALRAPGEHVIALRISSYRLPVVGRSSQLLFYVTTPAELEVTRWRYLAAPVMQVGAMALFALAAAVMWLVAARRRSLLLFAGMCLGCVVIQGSLIAEYTISRRYDLPWTFAGLAAAACAGTCLVALVAEQVGLRRQGWLVGAVLLGYSVVAAFTHTPWGNRPHLLMTVALLVALRCAAVAVARKNRRAWVACAGVLATLLLNLRSPLDFMRSEMLVGLLPLEVAMFTLIALDIRDERRRARDAQLTAARLEIELLKQNLQPHFLMNTLTALAQTVQEDPAHAVNLIADLAAEVRMLAGMSAEKHVPLGRELELCRAHLRVMRARTEVDWELHAEGVDEAARIPPALFLTLIENGFSHQRAAREAARFRLRARTENGSTRYAFFSPGRTIAEAQRVEGGTGLRYVRARLEESFPGGWALSHGARDGGWETIIELRALTPEGVRR